MPPRDDVTDPSDVIRLVVLGGCNCVPHVPCLPALVSHGLPTPQWEESWERVKGCFPGGCDVCGVWIVMKKEEQSLLEVVRELLEKTDLAVRGCVFSRPQLCHVPLQAVMGERPLVVASHTSPEEEDSVQVYEVGEAVSLQRLDVDTVGNYLSSHTHLLRVTSSLPAHIDPHHGTRGV